MASRTRTFPAQGRASRSLPALRSNSNYVVERKTANVLVREIPPSQLGDVVLFHNAADAKWCGQLAERIRGERLGIREIASVDANWNLSNAANIPAEAEKWLNDGRFLAIVLSERMLREDWPALEGFISALSDLNLAQGRIVTLLKENVTLPPLFRLHEWIDFRDGHRLEEGVREVVALLRKGLISPERNTQSSIGTAFEKSAEPIWMRRPLFLGAQKVEERIVSNLFPAVEIPKEIFSVESRFHTEAEVREACGGPGPLPFLLQGARLYAVAPITEKSVLGPAVKEGGRVSQERFSEWISDPQRTPQAMELLNRLLRHHAWKRGMRFDEGQKLFYFTRSKPKNLWWEIGGQTMRREVTAPHMKWNQIDGEAVAEFQCGWKHEAIRAEFVQVLGALFLRLEPAWFLTELDGKTPVTSQPVGPVQSFSPDQDQNGEILRTLRFWSAVLAKGHRELRVETGLNPIRVRLTPATGSSPSVISNDRLDLDALALTGIVSAQLIPELAPIKQ
jgi:TIR domain